MQGRLHWVSASPRGTLPYLIQSLAGTKPVVEDIAVVGRRERNRIYSHVSMVILILTWKWHTVFFNITLWIYSSMIPNIEQEGTACSGKKVITLRTNRLKPLSSEVPKDLAKERMSAASVQSEPSRTVGPSTRVLQKQTRTIVRSHQYSDSTCRH